MPPAAQYEIARTAIERRLHVFAEKPLATTASDARHLYSLASARGVVHAVDFMFPEIAEWRVVKDMLDRQAFGTCRRVDVTWTWLSGDIRHGRSTWRTDVAQGGGALSFYFSHGLHYLEHFLGPITEATYSPRQSPLSLNGGEVGFDLALRFESGARGHVLLACDSYQRPVHRLVFECDRGRIALETHDAVVDNFVVRTHGERGEQVVSVGAEPALLGEDERVKVIRRLARRFVAACTGGGNTYPSFQQAVRVQELVELIRQRA